MVGRPIDPGGVMAIPGGVGMDLMGPKLPARRALDRKFVDDLQWVSVPSMVRSWRWLGLIGSVVAQNTKANYHHFSAC